MMIKNPVPQTKCSTSLTKVVSLSILIHKSIVVVLQGFTDLHDTCLIVGNA